ncbi:hypothetical protein STAS_12228 [Striga asiatica]|uniref:Uncharacterized protein n=1 Tax=Striga asiatica TaxID=4170 RepID=A0A5A7PSV8_STRAF|nr:hypothetical protein STAS_12228 [Striga asiatica]
MKSIILSHMRSSSMPSRPYYALIPEFELHLQKIKSDNLPTTSSSSLSSIAEKMNNLEQIHDLIDNLLILPHTHQIFTRESHGKWVDEILDGYLGLVDACAAAKDFVSQSKDSISNLLSVLRRKRRSEDLSEFISSRKTIKKQIQKSLRKIRSYKNSSSVLKTGEKDQETLAIISMLKEAESITLELIEALLSSISHSKDGSKWPLVSKIMGSRKVSCHEHEHKSSMLEFGDLDASLSKFVSKCETGSKIEDLQRQLRKMELVITVIEERLECLFKLHHLKKDDQEANTKIIGSYKKNSSVLETGDKDHETIAIIGMLKEAESITLVLIEALLSSISRSKDGSRLSKWSLVSKLMGSRKVSCHCHEQKSSMLEFRDLDASLSKFVSKCETGSKIEELQQQLREMDLVIRVIEEILDTMKSIILSHMRSSSMPSRPYYPLIPEFKLHLQKIKSDNFPTSSSSSLSSIAEKMKDLEQIHDLIDNLLILPHTHQIFTRESHEKWVEQILDGYLGLVDACATAKDFISQSKDYISNLLSVLRRKRGSENLSEFISSRKTIKKQIQKSLRKLGSYKNSPSVLETGDKDQETIAIIGMLKEAESITLELIETLLSSISRSKDGSRLSNWSLVSKLVGSRKVSCHEHKSSMLGFEDLDASLSKIFSKCETGSKIEELKQQLREMDLVIAVIEERFESLFKRLIKSRVSLLNMQSQL